MRVAILLFLFANSVQAYPVAVISSDSRRPVEDVVKKLSSEKEFTSIGQHNLRNLPTLKVRAALFFHNGGTGNGRAVGDLIASLIDQGIGVVVATFTNTNKNATGPRFQNYSPFVGAQQDSGRFHLGKLLIPQHPILSGVQRISGYIYRSTQIKLHPKATLLAQWSDGQPLIAVRTDLNARIASLNLFPPSSDSSSSGKNDRWDASTDGGRLIANALKWAAHKKPFVKPAPPKPAAGSPTYDTEF